MDSMRRQLLLESGRQTLVSVGIFTALFVVLYAVEHLFPALRGTLLQWQDPAFVVGIPASVIGTAYVLTIRNPKNYFGFYGDILMALLLAVQFHLQKNYDLTLLYLAVFVPFGIISLLSWRTHTMQPQEVEDTLSPSWLSHAMRCASVAAAIIIVAIDYIVATKWIQGNGWGDGIALKLMGGLMIASSVLANILLIRQHIDAWIWWIIYSLAGMAFYIMVGNMFSLVLFFVFLLVNGSTGVAWLRRYGHTN